ncbi:S8 family serine peptidase [Haloimpatiens sp. FM7330]|uniref:S8 family serine peptidase n=1 Tax=Haloimpatiens sp. FM7330 TaxID=3298610 RepID=UPI00362F65A6
MKSKKIIGIVMSTFMIMSSINVSYALPIKESNPDKTLNTCEIHKMKLSNQIKDNLKKMNVELDSKEEVELLIISDLDVDITKKLFKCGASSVDRFVEGAYKIKIPAKNALFIAKISQALGVGTNQMIEIKPPNELPIAHPQLEYAHEHTTIKELWKKGYDGKGTTIAIIDTGVEPNHELLKSTSHGKLKIVDYQDFNYSTFGTNPNEGDNELKEVTPGEDGKVDIPYRYNPQVNSIFNPQFVTGTKEDIKVPENLKGKKVLATVYPEEKMIREDKSYFDLNNDGKANKYALVAYDGDNDGKYESILFDTDDDNDLSDEKVIGIYKDEASKLKDKEIFEMNEDNTLKVDKDELVIKDEYENTYNKLFNTIKNKYSGEDENIKNTRSNFVCTRVEKEIFGSWYINIAMDSKGHGTHVAGDSSANGYKSHEFVNKEKEPSGILKGAAPGAQIMALRVFNSNRGTSPYRYIKAMGYAAVHGADVVNMSLGGSPEFTDGGAVGALYANLLSTKYGTFFVMANGNEGPGVNSNGSPADSMNALSVGAYCPSYYVTGDDAKYAPDSMWSFSSNGPCDDGRIKPDIIAPGSMISSSPMWNIVGKKYNDQDIFKDWGGRPVVGYARSQGTSMASPYAAGCAAALKQVINEKIKNKEGNSIYHPLLLKEIIMKTADKETNNRKYNPVEIGMGMIDPVAAYNELINNYKNSDKLPKLLTGDNPSMQWPVDLSDKTYKYTSYKSNYLIPNVKYKNDDRMQSTAYGLYVRDKEIPENVSIDISNFTNRDVNLVITKETWGKNQKTDWLQVQNSLNVPKEKVQNLNVKIDKNKLEVGVNVLYIKLDDPETYQIDCIIPVTIIKSEALSVEKTLVEEEFELAPGEYQRMFVKVPKDLTKFKVTLEAPEEGDRYSQRIRPEIFMPNGLGYFWDNMYKYTGVQKPKDVDKYGKYVKKVEVVIDKEELKSSKRNSINKWDGTWEINPYSSIIAKGVGKAKVTVSSIGVVSSETEKDLDFRLGEKYSGNIKFSNTSEKTVNVSGFGFINLDKAAKKTRVEGLAAFRDHEEFFEIKKDDKNIYNKISIINSNMTKDDDMKISLRKAELLSDGKYIVGDEIKHKYISGNNLSSLVSEELEPGCYAVAATPTIISSGSLDFDILNEVVNQGDAVKNSMIINGNKAIEPGKLQEYKYTLKAPIKEGNYMAGILVRDDKGKRITLIPIRAEVGGTNNVIRIKQDKVSLDDEDLTLDLEADFGEVKEDKNKLYGIEFTLRYNPDKLSAKDLSLGKVFSDNPSYEVKKEIVKDKDGKEVGEIRFAYAFKGIKFNGITEGSIASIKFKANNFEMGSIDVDKMLLGNYEGQELAVKVEKQNIIVANPDINRDGIVNVKDYAYAAYSYGADSKDVRYRADADINKDDIIDELDINYIIKHFNYQAK